MTSKHTDPALQAYSAQRLDVANTQGCRGLQEWPALWATGAEHAVGAVSSHFVHVGVEDAIHEAYGWGLERVGIRQLDVHLPDAPLVGTCGDTQAEGVEVPRGPGTPLTGPYCLAPP